MVKRAVRYRLLVVSVTGVAAGLIAFLIWLPSSNDAASAIDNACRNIENIEGNYDATGYVTGMVGFDGKHIVEVSYGGDNNHGVVYKEDTPLLKDEQITIIIEKDADSGVFGTSQNQRQEGQARNEGSNSRLVRYKRSTNEQGEWGDWKTTTAGVSDQGASASSSVAGDASNPTEIPFFCYWPVQYFSEIKIAGEETISGVKATHYIATRSPGLIAEKERYDFWVDGSERLLQQKWDWGGAVFLATYSGHGEPNIIVAPVTGTLHEAFIDVGSSSGGAVGFTSAAGELVSAGFTVDGSATTIQELTWQNGTVSLTLSPQNTLTGYVLDFFAVDGTVSLSLDAATATAANGKLTWPVASQPWQDGDHLMLRIRETGSAPILPPTATATPAPTATPRPTPTAPPGVSGIVTSLSPTPLTIAVGETGSFTLGVKPTVLGIRVEANAAGDTGNLSLNGECPGAADATEVGFNGYTVELLGCTAGTVLVGLYQAVAGLHHNGAARAHTDRHPIAGAAPAPTPRAANSTVGPGPLAGNACGGRLFGAANGRIA